MNSVSSINPALQHSLLSSMQTGSPIYDILIGTFIVSILGGIIGCISKVNLKNIPSLYQEISDYLRWGQRWYNNRKKNIKTKRAVISYITPDKEINELYTPVLWKINKLTNYNKSQILNFSSTEKMKDITTTIPRGTFIEFEYKQVKIKYRLVAPLIKIYADRERDRENFTIELEAEVEETNTILSDFIIDCQKDYNYHRLGSKKWIQKIYYNKEGKWSFRENPHYERDFQTVILKNGDKENLTSDFDDFLESEKWYLQRDLPYTRRYLFYGTPGTGKTSTIKALASKSTRNIHYLLLNEVGDDNELLSLFCNIDYDKTIVVIEDIDCATDIITERSQKEEKNKEEKENDKEEKKGITLSGFLNAMDGVFDNHGQVMIMTTNYPRKLDSALLRPGRIDRKFEFLNCDKEQLLEIVNNFFGDKNFSLTEQDISSIDPDNYSPADLVSCCLQCKHDPKRIVKLLLEKPERDSRLKLGFKVPKDTSPKPTDSKSVLYDIFPNCKPNV